MKSQPLKKQRCKICGLSADDVLHPENFKLNNEGICFQCWMEKYQVIPDYRSPLQQYLDELGEDELDEVSKDEPTTT